MINLQLSVREAIRLATINGEDFREKIISAFEVALGVNQKRIVTITGGMNLDNRIKCIRAIRNHTGWDLKESKYWSDVLVGGWKYDGFVPAARDAKNSITLKTPEAAENLLRDLVEHGCEGFLS
jgi:hypothetical protein